MANDRDCENCKHYKEVLCKGGIFYHSCESWDCEFEPKEDEPFEPCEDCISRQAVLDSIHANCVYENEYNLTAKHIEDAVKQLPPVTPQPKTGQWMFVDKAKEHARCSECGYGDVDLFNGKPHNYCEKCGVKMESEVQS